MASRWNADQRRSRTVLTRALRVAAAALGATLVIATCAQADTWREGSASTEVGKSKGGGTTVTIGVGEGVEEVGTGSGGSAAGARVCHDGEADVPCTRGGGVWSDVRECYVSLVSPQPPLSDPIWDGHTDGAVYTCAVYLSGQPRFAPPAGGSYQFWSPAPEQAIDPESLARQAVERMRLVPPSLGLTPLTEGAPLPVGVDAWLWIADAGPRSFGPISRSASAGATTVRATARVVRVTWAMGDGGTVTCTDAGTAWTPEAGSGPSPTCGYRYSRAATSRPGGVFPVTATTHWVVDWSGAGRSGQLAFSMSSQGALRVVEVQALQVA